MKTCRHTGLSCPSSGRCEDCRLNGETGQRWYDTLVPAGRFKVPDPHPYVKVRDMKDGPAVELGIWGTF